MPTKPHKPRKLRRALVGLSALLLMVLAGLPFWFPLVLPATLQHWGVRYRAYERLNYRTFRLADVHWQSGSWTLHAERVDACFPGTWLWRLWQPSWDKDRNRLLQVDGWNLEMGAEPSGTRTETPGITSTSAALTEMRHGLRMAERWLGNCAFTQGEVHWPSGMVRIPQATWSANGLTLDVEGTFRRREERGRVVLRPVGHGVVLHSELNPQDLRLELLLRPLGAGWRLDGDLGYAGRKARCEALFAENGWLPGNGGVRLTGFDIPREWLDLPGYAGVRGDLDLTFARGEMKVRVDGRALARDAEGLALPELQLTLGLRSRTNGVFLDTVEAHGPGLELRLSESVGFAWDSRLITGPALLLVDADLARFPPRLLEGKARGSLQIRQGPAGQGVLWANLEGTGLRWRDQELSRVALQGRLDWPQVDVDRLEISGPGGLELIGVGSIDLAARTVKTARWDLAGTNLASLLPGVWSGAGWTSSGHLKGPFTQLQHEGSLTVNAVHGPWLAPSDLRASWTGTALGEAQLQLELVRGSEQLQAKARIRRPATNLWAMDLESLDWDRAGTNLGRLQSPARFQFQPGDEPWNWSAAINGFDWRGDDRWCAVDAELEWPRSGRFTVGAGGWRSADLQPFTAASLPRASLPSLHLQGSITNGLVTAQAAAEAGLHPPDLPPLVFRGGLECGPRECRLNSVVLGAEASPGLRLDGGVPLTLHTGRAGIQLQWLNDAEFSLRGEATESGRLWDWLTERTGVRCTGPQIRVEVQGRPTSPRVSLLGRVKQLAWLSPDGPALPPLDGVDLRLTVEDGVARLEECRGTVEGQPVQLTAYVPFRVEPATGGQIPRAMPDLQGLSALLLIQDAELAPFRTYLPPVLVPRGRLGLRLECQPGLQLQGWLDLRDAATQPIGLLLPIRDIQAHARFDGREVVVEQGSGSIGGERVELTGRFDLSHDAGIGYAFDLRGNNVPLLRQPGMVVRSDLALTLTATNGLAPLVAGTLHLRDSLVARDLGMLLPTSGPAPEWHASALQVEEEPFASWQTDLVLRSDRTLRVQSPVFSGVGSADLRLQGRLGDPVLYGELRVNEGQVKFPFGNLAVNYGTVTLAQDQPGEVGIDLEAASRTYGYQLQMQVSGALAHPQVTFNSTPPLGSQQILLLLTAGQLPRDEARFSTTDKMGRLGVIVGRDLLGQLGFGGGSAERLEVRSGANLSSEGRPTYEIEYRLDDAWSAFGEYDRFGGINGGLKLRVYSR